MCIVVPFGKKLRSKYKHLAFTHPNNPELLNRCFFVGKHLFEMRIGTGLLESMPSKCSSTNLGPIYLIRIARYLSLTIKMLKKIWFDDDTMP